MRLILLGPPGVGKGTIAKALAEKLSLPHISTGDMLRQAIRQKTSLGKKLKACVESGGLVPDEMMVSLIKERVSLPDCERGFILDGFPRTIGQARSLSDIETGAAALAIYLNASREVIISRLSGRLICSSCQRIYHAKNMPSSKPGVCDSCGGKLVVREDDRENVVRERLLRYEEEARSLLEFYRERNLLREVNSNMEPEKVLENILLLIG
jgi:adenylate kinase